MVVYLILAVLVLDLSNSVIKMLWCIQTVYNFVSRIV